MDKTVFQRPVFIYSICILFFLVQLAPLLCYKYFPTVDGPSHLYNATILRELLFGNSEYYSPFFEFNSEPVPNWTGHIVAIISGLILPVWAVEKLVLLLIVAGMPAGLILLSRNFGYKISWNVLLLLPFIYTLTLYLGFFNFMLGIVLMLFVLASLTSSAKQTNFIKWILLLTLLYFTHLLAFGLALAFTGIYLFWNSFTGKLPLFSRKNMMVLAGFIPGILLAVHFFFSRSVEGFRKKVEMLPVDTLLKWMKDGAPFIGLNEMEEAPYTSVFALGIVVIFVLALILRIRAKEPVHAADSLLIFSMLMLACYFVIPDGMVSGGFISLRILLVAYLFIIAWIFTVKMPPWLIMISALAGVYTGFATLPYRLQAAKDLNRDASEFVNTTGEIPAGSVVLPLNYSPNWLHINLSGYAGAVNRLVILDNYEATLEEFPLKWKPLMAPGDNAGNFTQSLNPEVTIDRYETATGNKIDYVTRWWFNSNAADTISVKTSAELESHFHNKTAGDRLEIFFR